LQIASIIHRVVLFNILGTGGSTVVLSTICYLTLDENLVTAANAIGGTYCLFILLLPKGPFIHKDIIPTKNRKEEGKDLMFPD